MAETFSDFRPENDSDNNLLFSFGIASLIVVLGVMATWLVIKRTPEPLNPTAHEVVIPDVTPSVGNAGHLTLLEQAELAFAAGRIIEPEYDNALSYYTSLLEQEPENPAAIEGVERVKSYLLTQADSAMYQNDWDAARAYARVIQSIEPGNVLAKQINDRSNQLESILQLSDEAVGRLAAGNLISPKGGSAVDSYRKILKMDPANVVALEGIRSISQRLIASAQTAIFAGNAKQARELISEAQRIDPAAPGLVEAKKSAREWEQVVKDRAVQKLLTEAANALQENRLMPPAEDSAFKLYQSALKREPESEAAKRGIELVQTLLLDRALSRLNAEDIAGGEEAIELASQAGADQVKLERAVAELKYRKRLVDARNGVFDRNYALSELTLLHRENPEYPRAAAQREKEGWVQVEFVVTEKGDVRSARVLDSSSELFERNALAAVSNWKFEAVMQDGRPVPVRAAVKFTFK